MIQWEALERETLALIGVIGAARAQGAEIEIPTLHDARADFDAWLTSAITGTAQASDETVMKRALGLNER